MEENLANFDATIGVLSDRLDAVTKTIAQLKKQIQDSELVKEETLVELEQYIDLKNLEQHRLETLQRSAYGLGSPPNKPEGAVLNWASASVTVETIQDHIDPYSLDDLQETFVNDNRRTERKFKQTDLKRIIRDCRKFHLHKNIHWRKYWSGLSEDYRLAHHCPIEASYIPGSAPTKVLELRVVAIFNFREPVEEEGDTVEDEGNTVEDETEVEEVTAGGIAL